MAFERLARAEEVPPGRTKFVRTARRPVILANWDGQIYALDGVCPHQENLLEGAQVWDYLLDCPWHHFQYDVRTGANHFPKNVYPGDMPHLARQVLALKTFSVRVTEGEIWVDLG